MNHEELLFNVFQGNESALQFAGQLGRISQIWDDLIDRDKQVTNDDINAMMYGALVQMHKNPFYLQHQNELDLLIEHAIDAWQEANDLESKGELLIVAYSLRSSITPVIIRMAYMIGGREWGLQCSHLIRHAVFDDQPFEDYVIEVTDGLS